MKQMGTMVQDNKNDGKVQLNSLNEDYDLVAGSDFFFPFSHC